MPLACLVAALSLVQTPGSNQKVGQIKPATISQSKNKIKVPYEKYRLPNGLKVILHVDKTLPVVTINTWFYVGSKDEPERRSGFAHLFEHLMFMGTNRVPTGQFDSIMEAGGGQNNASTAQDRTNYYSVGPSQLLPTLLWLDADRLEDLAKAMDLKKVDLQREVVKNERRQNVENEPYGKAQEAINGLMYPKGHPYSTSVIGSHEDLSAASVEDVKEFFNRFYVPSNASLVVAGNFDPAKIKPLINKLFGTLPRGNDVVRKPVMAARLTSTKRITLTDSVSAPKTFMVWHSPASFKAGDFAMRLSSDVLGNGVSSRLYKKLVAELGLATDVSAYQDSNYLGSLFTISATLAPGKSQDALEKAIDEVVSTYTKNGPVVGEIRRWVAKTEAASAAQLQSIDQKADLLNTFEFYLGEPDSFEKYLDAVRSQTTKGVQGVADSVFKMDQRLILRVIPELAQTDKNPRDDRPTIGDPLAFSAPKPTRVTLKSGANAHLWSRPGVPLLSLTLNFPGGTAYDPKGKDGLNSLLAEMLQRGAGDLTAPMFSDQLAELGANINISAGVRGLEYNLEVPISNIKPALALLKTEIQSPRFDAKEWKQLVAERTAEIEDGLTNPRTMSSIVATREFFGLDHPLGRRSSGTLSSLKSITLDDVKSFWKSTYMGSEPKIFAASGASVAELESQLNTVFGASLRWKPKTLKGITYSQPKAERRLFIVDKPGAVQTVISFYLPAPNYFDGSRLALEGVTNALGGSFTSRLNNNLREQKGYTYGAFARYTPQTELGWLTLGSSVRADVTGPSLVEFLKEMERMEQGDLTIGEVKKVQELLRNEQITQFQTLGGITSTALGLSLLGTDLTAVDKDLLGLPKLTQPTLNALAKKWFRRDQSMIVLVGDQKLILEQIKGLGLPTPKIVTP